MLRHSRRAILHDLGSRFVSVVPTDPERRIRVTDFHAAKRRRERWAMLTSYDQYTATLFDQAGVWALLVGDSAANNVYGYETTLPVTVDELLPLVRAGARSGRRAPAAAGPH